jgi:hypothetical protein
VGSSPVSKDADPFLVARSGGPGGGVDEMTTKPLSVSLNIGVDRAVSDESWFVGGTARPQRHDDTKARCSWTGSATQSQVVRPLPPAPVPYQDFPNLLFGFHLSLEYNDSLF